MKCLLRLNTKLSNSIFQVSQLERDNESLCGDLQDRPTMSQLEAKVQLADELQLELLTGQLKVTELRVQLEDSVRRYEELSGEMQRMKVRQEELLAQQQEQQRDMIRTKEDEEMRVREEERVARDREAKERELDERMLTSPLVEVEEELVLYKEKFAGLSETNVRLQREMEETRKKYEDVMQRSMVRLLMYMGPVVAIVGYFVLWPYL